MESSLKSDEIAAHLGIEAVDRVVALAEAYCGSEAQRIELTNQARVHAVRAELSIHADEVVRLEERLRAAGLPGDRRARRRQAAYYWAVALILIVASFFFSVIALDPYQLGWKGYLYCVGIAVVTPFCVEKFLEVWECRRLLKALATTAFLGAILSLVLLAVIRGDVLAQQNQAANPVVEIDDESSPSPQAPNTFYQETLALLRFAMASLAVAIELASGLALHHTRRLGACSGEDYEEVSGLLRAVQFRMAELLHERAALSNEASVFATRFWRNFYHAMLTHTLRKGLIKLLLLLLFIPAICGAQARPAKHLNLVIELDLSSSVDARGRDNKTEFEKNVSAISRLLASIPPGTKITILGITENTFSQPYVLLSAKVTDEKGYFGEKLAAAREQIVRAWLQLSAHLEPRARGTDILGATVVAGQIFLQEPGAERKILLFYSDMRHYTRHLDLETSAVVPLDAALPKAEKGLFLPDLRDVEVYAIGVDAAGKDVAHWDGVHRFWVAYFHKVGANLKGYTILREAPALGP